ncbi:hypothetical protein EJB05_19087 [Eragrostis curvula]|uniref:Uncharacterized protein n=1 Tax=Eragrostis curvula TaxID=38414 RepID=A0A5J9UW85_9POAL|nr:hypothetical protein EJB05_19087 [Eragrostis curvula]
MGRGGGMGNPVNVGIAVQADWENREFISNISLNVRRLFDFLIRFEATTKSKLASLNEKLDTLERKLEVLEVQKRGHHNFSIVMMNVLSGHHQNVKLQVRDMSLTLGGRSCRVQYPYALDGAGTLADPRRRHRPFIAVRAVSGSGESSSGEDDDQDKPSKKEEGSSGSAGLSREDLERLVGTDDDAKFSGLDLANLIRKKYGRSYDVTLIKKEFMGRNLLAMNVMWKYREQRSFPLSEEEYLLRLDDVANTLKCWGAVAHVRNTLEKLKERPRIGKVRSKHLHRHGPDRRALKRMDLQVISDGYMEL